MTTCRWIALVVLLVLGCFAVSEGPPLRAQGGSPAGSPLLNAEVAARLAPLFDSRSADFRSFEVKGFHAPGVVVSFHCVSAAPRRACVVLYDQVPVFVAAEGQILLYDPVSGPRLWRTDWGVFLGMTDEGVTVRPWLFEVGNAHAGLLIDLPAILARASEGRTITEMGGPRYRLMASTPSGGHLEAWIDLSRSGRYTRLTATPSGEQRPYLDVSIASVDEPIDPRAFLFPRFAERLSLSPPTEMTRENLGQGLQQMGTAVFFHQGLHVPMARAELERKLGRSLDWTGLQQREAAIAPLLRQAIETDSALRPP